jgi:transcriptional regulator with XRE-family HTH domain
MRYCEMLRAGREKAGKSVEDVAREVGLSTSYLRDVELGRRAPLSPDHTRRLARAIVVDAVEMVRAGMLDRDVVQLDMRGSDAHRLLGVRLLAVWDLLTDAEALQLVGVLDGMRLPDGRRVGGG